VYIESFLGVPGSLFDVQFAPSKLVFVYRVIRYIHHISFPLIHIGGIQAGFRRISYADVYTTIGEYWQIFVGALSPRRAESRGVRTVPILLTCMLYIPSGSSSGLFFFFAQTWLLALVATEETCR
jgi:hypothetical protein